MQCERYRRQVRAMARSETAGHTTVQQHVAGCLRCQAEMARERLMVRRLRTIRRDSSVPGGLLERILASVDEAGQREIRHGSGSRTAGVVAGAGALVGVIVVGLTTRAGRRVLGLAS